MTKLKNILPAITVGLCMLLCVNLVLSSVTLWQQRKTNNMLNQNYGETQDIDQEDDVTIASQYTIKSTLQISDAYKSGDASKLDDTDKETLDMAKDVVDKIITDDMTDYEKEKAVYEYLVNDLTSTTGILTVVPAIEQENDNPHDVLKYKTAVCVGYATTFRMFMQMFGIECKVIHNKELFHSWNLVKLDGDWYHVDCYSDNDSTTYLNFNMNDTQSAVNHDWTREYFPKASGTKYNYILSVCEPIKDIYEIPEWVMKAVEEKKTVISCTFKTPITEKNEYEALAMTNSLNERIGYGDNYTIESQWSQNDKGEYVLSYFINYLKDDEATISDETQYKIDAKIDEVINEYGFENAYEEY